MWLSFVLACAMCVGLLYLPGFLLLFSMGRLRWYDAVACAPLVGVGCYAAIAILIHLAGITASAAVIVLPVLVAGAALALLRLFISNKKSLVFVGGNKAPEALGAFGSPLVTTSAYLLAGVLVVGFVFVKNLDGAASVFQAYDNGSHLNAIATALSSGNYSSFLGDYYSEPNAVSPFLETAAAFYPRAWHELVALVVEVMGIPISLGINAVDTVLLGVVYPLGMHSLLRRLFDGNNRFVLLGAILCLAFPAGVLDFVTFGPLYPMLLAYVLAPAAMASFIELTSPDQSPLSSRIGWGILFVTGCVSIALSQPSGIFLMAVLLAPLVVFRSHQICTKYARNIKIRTAVPVLVSLSIACIWYGLYRFPPFESLVSFNWPATDGVSQAVADVLLFSMSSHSAQPIVAVFVFLGILVAVRDSNRRVFIFPYLFTGLTYVLCVATEGDFKHLLGGFWYTDPHRVAANVALAANGRPAARCVLSKH